MSRSFPNNAGMICIQNVYAYACLISPCVLHVHLVVFDKNTHCAMKCFPSMKLPSVRDRQGRTTYEALLYLCRNSSTSTRFVVVLVQGGRVGQRAYCGSWACSDCGKPINSSEKCAGRNSNPVPPDNSQALPRAVLHVAVKSK
jgi:hypothetical protein